MYPLNMSNGAGYAVANDESEHKALTNYGYGPAFAGAVVSTEQPADDTKEGLRAKLDAAGIDYDSRWGVAKLAEALKGAA